MASGDEGSVGRFSVGSSVPLAGETHPGDVGVGLTWQASRDRIQLEKRDKINGLDVYTAGEEIVVIRHKNGVSKDVVVRCHDMEQRYLNGEQCASAVCVGRGRYTEPRLLVLTLMVM